MRIHSYNYSSEILIGLILTRAEKLLKMVGKTVMLIIVLIAYKEKYISHSICMLMKMLCQNCYNSNDSCKID